MSLWLIIASTLGCSIPNLETSACIESRDIVREFYSFHLDSGLAFSAEALKERERFLTPEFVGRLRSQAEGADPFTTGTTDFPRAFRVGECTKTAADKTVFEVLLFWRDDIRTEQKTIRVETEDIGEKWLIDSVKFE